MKLSVTIFYFIVICFQAKGLKDTSEVNTRPVIAILALPEYKTNRQYISASYVKFVELAGAKVLPVYLNHSKDYYQKVIEKTNGLLFTGGGVILTADYTNYVENARTLWENALHLNAKGIYYPIWGTCLGFELITFLASNGSWPFVRCHGRNLATNLKFMPDGRNYPMFRNANDKVLQILAKENSTFHYHQWCMTRENFKISGLSKSFFAHSTSEDKNGINFIATIESKDLPIYGVMFHPERVIFDSYSIKNYNNTPKSSNAVIANQHFANFFVNETRKNPNRYPEDHDDLCALMDCYCPTFTGGQKSSDQIYYI